MSPPLFFLFLFTCAYLHSPDTLYLYLCSFMFPVVYSIILFKYMCICIRCVSIVCTHNTLCAYVNIVFLRRMYEFISYPIDYERNSVVVGYCRFMSEGDICDVLRLSEPLKSDYAKVRALHMC